MTTERLFNSFIPPKKNFWLRPCRGNGSPAATNVVFVVVVFVIVVVVVVVPAVVACCYQIFKVLKLFRFSTDRN